MSPGKGLLWTGRILSIVFVLFMIMDGVMKIVRPPSVVEGSAKMGYVASTLPGIGVALLLCTLLYVVPKTRVLGGLLLTGYLGGAVASQVRVGPLPSNSRSRSCLPWSSGPASGSSNRLCER